MRNQIAGQPGRGEKKLRHLRSRRRWLETEWPEVGAQQSGRPTRDQTVFRAEGRQVPAGSKSRPWRSQSVRSSEEAGNDRGAKGRRKVEVRRTERRKSKPTRVPARASRWWNQPSAIGLVDTERLTDGLGDEAKSRSLSTEHPPTGKPDAGEPPVRFGGRGGVQTPSLPLFIVTFRNFLNTFARSTASQASISGLLRLRSDVPCHERRPQT